MNCPYCGKEMTKGYLSSRDPLTWRTKKSALPVLDPLAKDAVILAGSGTVLVVHRCEECRKFVIDCADGEHNEVK
ncbi:MAG: hypothetical protein IKI93_10325 [Clostridia bacterium]|nr:hypothetical protein [Clostridia bacterium]